MTTTDLTSPTGHRGIDRLIARATERGLHVEIDDKDGDRSFVVVRIHNRGLAGANGLNDAQVSLYVSFTRSARGRWCGGYYTPTLGKIVEFNRHGGHKGLDRAMSYVGMLWVAPEHRTASEVARGEQERRWYDEQTAHIAREI